MRDERQAETPARKPNKYGDGSCDPHAPRPRIEWGETEVIDVGGYQIISGSRLECVYPELGVE